jgi:hypothetical protein
MAAPFRYFHHHLPVAYRRGVEFFLPEANARLFEWKRYCILLSIDRYICIGVRIIQLLATANFTLVFRVFVRKFSHVNTLQLFQ